MKTLLKTFKIKSSWKIFASLVFLFWTWALVVILQTMIQEGNYVSLMDQAKIVLFVSGLAMTIYGLFYFFLFEIRVDEERVQVRSPISFLSRQDRYSLRWDEIERLELEPFLFVESKRYVLKPKKGSGKRPIKFPSAIEHFSELAELILRKVEAPPMAKGAINYDLAPHKLSFRRFLLLVVVAVIILLVTSWMLGII